MRRAEGPQERDRGRDWKSAIIPTLKLKIVLQYPKYSMYQTMLSIGYMVLNKFAIVSLQSNVYKGHRPQPSKLFNIEMVAVQYDVCSSAEI